MVVTFQADDHGMDLRQISLGIGSCRGRMSNAHERMACREQMITGCRTIEDVSVSESAVPDECKTKADSEGESGCDRHG
jgi:hypothetical protein